MDGRAHPSECAAHTCQGCSTGLWQGETLRVDTTHLKKSYLQLNGVCHGDHAVLTEFFIRQDRIPTWISVTTDLVYLEEPRVRSANWVFNPRQQMAPTLPTEIVDEIRGHVPHDLPGLNPWLDAFAGRVSLPFKATNTRLPSRWGAALRHLSPEICTQ